MTMGKIARTDLDKKEIRAAYLINGYIRHHLTVGENNELDEWVCISMRTNEYLR
jgi:hypothetical protein